MKGGLLQVFVNDPEKWFSGAELAAEMGISRSAVWKQIEGLRAQGLAIEAAPRKGYRLSAEANLLNAVAIQASLDENKPFQLMYQPTIDSTNKKAAELAGEGAPEWTTVVADSQSAGSGRRGRHFYSPAGVGIYMTVILRPQVAAEEATLLTMAAALAVAETAEAFSEEKMGIKWVNDIYRGQAKIAGILTEAALSLEEKSLRWAVVGIGLNVYPHANEAGQGYGSLFDGPREDPLLRSKMAASILDRLYTYTQALSDRPYLEGYRDRLFFLNKPADLVTLRDRRTVIPRDVDEMGHLIIENEAGRRETISTGEISLRPHELGELS
ncbi:biotin--[acetyl-CoA-carboxylase] ligase [Peptococcus simiae]|uniref:biotin--[acetyl-CoA-carboxylase] ligase n=1 Tax=Peptococcus simiae TaxID=1643805 RepID=UPI00397F815C